MKKRVVSMSLAGLLLVTTPIIPIHPQQTTTLEQKVGKTFPKNKIGEIENFRQYADDIMYIIAEKMHIKIDENIPKPKIVTDDDITPKEFSKLLGYPEDFFNAVCPYYFHKQNMILVLNDTTLHTLAHEFVHYFQVKYNGIDPDDCGPFIDFLEGEAISIQHWFKEKYMQ